MGNLKNNFGDESLYSMLGVLIIAAILTVFIVKYRLTEKYGLVRCSDNTILQMAFAIATEFAFAMCFYKSESLIPCIITHSIVNLTSKFLNHNISEQSLQNVLLTAANYKIEKGNKKITAKTLIVYGSKEAKLCKGNTELISQQIIDCQCTVLEGFDHGELSIGNPQKHVEMLRAWME